jgi:hypothetical protein
MQIETFGAIIQSDRHGNTQLAFTIAERHLGIPVGTRVTNDGALGSQHLCAATPGSLRSLRRRATG